MRAIVSDRSRAYIPSVFYWTLMTMLLASDFVFWRWADLRLKAQWARIALALFIVLQIAYMLTILYAAFVPRHDSNIIIIWGFCLAYAWHLLVIPPTLTLIGLVWIWKRFVHSSDKSKHQIPKLAYQETLAEGPSRRAVLRSAIVAVPPLLAFGGLGIGASELFHFRVRRIVATMRALPTALDGLTISHVSDSHVGRFTNDRMLDAIAQASNSLNADLTLFAGDLIDVALADLPPAIRFAKKLKSRYGVYFCEGNHDLIEDGTHRTRIFETETRAAGLNMLFDQSATLRIRDYPVQIIGERWTGPGVLRSQRTIDLMALRDPAAFGILLTHHPHCWDHATTPLTIAGHTHGGQLMLTEKLGVGPIMFRYWSGLYQRGDQSLVVSNGTGNWFPVRTMAPAEIIHLTLRCA